MRKGFLVTLLPFLLTAAPALAQYPAYYPPPRPQWPPMQGMGYYPPPMQGMGYYPPPMSAPAMMMPREQPKTVYMGGGLRADGPIALPSVRSVAYQLAPEPMPNGPPLPGAPMPVPTGNQAAQPTPSGQLPQPTNAGIPQRQIAPPLVVVQEQVELPPGTGVGPSGPEFAPQPYIPTARGIMPARAPRGYSFYGNMEFLYWWVSPHNAPPLLNVTNGGTAFTIGGGELNHDDNQRTGSRTTLGYWCDGYGNLGLETTFFYLGDRTMHVDNTNANGAALTVPIIDANTGATLQIPVDTSSIQTFSRVWGAEANVRKELCQGPWGHLDLLLGFRHLHIDESLSTFSTVQLFPGESATINDTFGTQTQFWGGQLGLDAEFQLTRRIFFGMWGKVALGDNHQLAMVDGSTRIPGLPDPLQGGIFALPNNIGSYSRDQFTVVPEICVRLGARVTDNIRVAGGYNFLFVSNVLRPGEQVDINVNPTAVPGLFGLPTGADRPEFRFNDSSYFMHGITAQVEYRF